MKSSFRFCLLIPAILAGLTFQLQCNRDGGGAGRQSHADEIMTSRTMGLAHLEENNLEGAETEFRKLVSLAPDEAIGYANLGLVYLRTGEYEVAEKNLTRALEITPEDPGIRFNLATVYKYMNDHDRFISELEKNIRSNPDHIQTLYRLAESYSGSGEASDLKKRVEYLLAATRVSPGNIVPRLHLVETQLRTGAIEEALVNLQEVRRLFPEVSQEAKTYYRKAYDAMVGSDADEALTSTLVFHNFLKLTNPYQNGISELKGFEGSSVGVPAFTFSKSLFGTAPDGSSILESISFTDITEAAGLDLLDGTLSGDEAGATHLTLGDFNHDGSDDIYVGTYTETNGDYHSFMLEAGLGRFKDMAPEFGIRHRGEESFAGFSDYDNDGWFDLLVINRGIPVLHRSADMGVYEDVSKKAFGGKLKKASQALFFDMDHEGDLDVLFTTDGPNVLMRNNGDGTFSDFTAASGLAGSESGSREACFGDFDDDGDIDLFLVGKDGKCGLYTNIREGKFRDITEGSGLDHITDATISLTGDYNNDGFMDLFICGKGTGSAGWFMNNGHGIFEKDDRSESVIPDNPGFRMLDARFFDFDNDGYLDLLITGDPSDSGAPGGILLHNDGSGKYENTTGLLPPDFSGGRQIEFGDFNDDGDQDIFVAGLHGGVRLLRNDGGNANHHLKVRLRGIRTGSGKNNHYGIGAKIELRAGNHYQMQVVTGPNVYFGLADRSDVDVVRILWTNGTPQNIFTPGIEQDLIEEQQLKGSCPFLYAWDGEQFGFVKDVMWRSALGMPMGIMGEGQTYAFAEASEDYHRIPGKMLKPKDGMYTIQVTEELWETIYLDQVELVAVDHPRSADVFVDEHFIPPPYPPLKIHPVRHKFFPVAAENASGHNVLDRVIEKDDRYVHCPPRGRYQGITEPGYLMIDPGKEIDTDGLMLCLNGWIFPTDASINLALSQGNNEEIRAPYLQVVNREGRWETVIETIGFPQGKDKTIITSLDGVFLSGDRRIRICTNMEIYWDQLFFTHEAPDTPVKVTRLAPVSADHHYRGFSRMFRKGGPWGPHWFDYNEVSPGPKWRDLEGHYTRFGDVTELLLEPDNKYIIANAGDETTIRFDASGAEELPEGWTRDFLFYVVGWVKDGDMNTAEGNRVGPLPFHGMKEYPYDDPGLYPASEELRKYHEKYNTRKVTGESFRRAVFSMQ